MLTTELSLRSALYARVLPRDGGGTIFASMHAVHDRLDPALRARIPQPGCEGGDEGRGPRCPLRMRRLPRCGRMRRTRDDAGADLRQSGAVLNRSGIWLF
ncbi:hypothetical protein ACFQX4_16105 [Roseomonas sp. GCM10028921]